MLTMFHRMEPLCAGESFIYLVCTRLCLPRSGIVPNEETDEDGQHCTEKEKPLTNQARGPYCKLRTPFFPIDLWPKCENEVSKIFVISLYLETERAKTKFKIKRAVL